MKLKIAKTEKWSGKNCNIQKICAENKPSTSDANHFTLDSWGTESTEVLTNTVTPRKTKAR